MANQAERSLRKGSQAILLVLALSFKFHLNAQDTFLVQLAMEQAGWDATAKSVREVSDGFLVFGEIEWQAGTDARRCVVYRLSADGSLVGATTLNVPNGHRSFFGKVDPVAQIDTGGFIASVTQYWGPDQRIMTYRFNELGDSVGFSQVLAFTPQDSVGVWCQQIRPTEDGGFIACGSHYEEDADQQSILLKLDATGSLQWTRTYGLTAEYDEAIGVAQYVDGGYVLTGSAYGGWLPDKNFLIRTDSVGEQMWRKDFGVDGGVFGAVRVLTDGTIVTWSDYQDEVWLDDWKELMLTKWNSEGQVLWQNHMAYWQNSMSFDFEVLPDQSFITCASFAWKGLLMKLDAQGDSLWGRRLAVFDHLGGTYPYDVELATDGGYLLCGEARQTIGDPMPGLETIWLAKTDSLGCVVPGCQNVGVQEYVMDLQQLLRVSPNPAREVVHIVLDLPEGGAVEGRASVRFLDACGRLVLEEDVRQNLNTLRASIEVSALPAGTYYLHLRDAKRWLAGSKVVVE